MRMKILVFSGTTEGREISEFLADNAVPVTVCVATEYGSMVMPVHEGIEVRTGRLDEDQIYQLIGSYAFVIDATHPYAEIVSRNIKAACTKAGREYIRLLRPAKNVGKAVTVQDTGEAVSFLNTVEGNVLLTTGSKELEAYTAVTDFENRLFARVLPTAEVVEKCINLGFKGKNLICMQGPFSHDMNLATLKQTGAKYLVTKDTGSAGGFEEKISAARKAGVEVVLIARPAEYEGYTLEELKEILGKRLVPAENIEVPLKNNPIKMEYGRFPLFIGLSGKKVLVVGGGAIAARRVKILKEFGADIDIVSPRLSEELQQMLENRQFIYRGDTYKREYLKNKYMVIAATDSREINHRVYTDAEEFGILANIADCKDECSFYFPAVFKLGGIVGGMVSEDGSDHKLVKAVAERIRKLDI